MRKRILVDVDGVLANYPEAAARVLSRESGKVIRAEDIRTFDVLQTIPNDVTLHAMCKRKFVQTGFCESIPVYEGAAEAIEKLRSEHDVYFVTAPLVTSRAWLPERLEWLVKYFNADPERVVFASHKHIVSGDVLIEDNPENVTEWLNHNPNGLALLWDRPYNTNVAIKTTRVSSWGEIFEAMNREVPA